MDLRRLLSFLKRWAWLLLACALLAGGVAYAMSAMLAMTPMYEARATVLVGTALSAVDTDPSQLEASQRIAPIYVELATSRPLLDRVAAELELGVTGDALRAGTHAGSTAVGEVTTTTPGELPTITVTARAADPETAAGIANEVVRQLKAQSPELEDEDENARRFLEQQVEILQSEVQSLLPEIERLAGLSRRNPDQEEELSGLRERLTELQRTYAALIAESLPSSSARLTILEEAVPPRSPITTNEVRNATFAGILGLVSAMAILLIIEHLDDTVRSPEDIRRATNFPSLGEIRKLHRGSRRPSNASALELQPHSDAEAFDSLRTNLDLVEGGVSGTVLVASPHRREGRTTVATLLAAAFARAERSVLLVDADLHQPSIHRAFGVPNRVGLRELLQTPALSLTSLTQATRMPGLRILTAGQQSPHPFHSVDTARMKRVLRDLAATADVVILDSPAILSGSAAALASAADATLVVVAAGRTPANSLIAAAEVLSRAGARVVGTVLNRVAGAGSKDERQRFVANFAPRESRRTALQADSEDL